MNRTYAVQFVVAQFIARRLGRVGIYVKLSVIVGARSPRPLTNTSGELLTIQVGWMLGRVVYRDNITGVLRHNLGSIEPEYYAIF